MDVASPPLDEGALADGWAVYLSAWRSGSPGIQRHLANFVAQLDDDPDAADRFAMWAFSKLFDDHGRTPAAGAWGGGMNGPHGLHPTRPGYFALMKYPLTGRILLPCLLARFTRQPAEYARWLYLFHRGLGYRLPPLERSQLEAVMAPYCDDFGYRSLLFLAIEGEQSPG